MRNFMEKHPALEDSLDTILSILVGSLNNHIILFKASVSGAFSFAGELKK